MITSLPVIHYISAANLIKLRKKRIRSLSQDFDKKKNCFLLVIFDVVVCILLIKSFLALLHELLPKLIKRNFCRFSQQIKLVNEISLKTPKTIFPPLSSHVSIN